jgi:hypothetical protein
MFASLSEHKLLRMVFRFGGVAKRVSSSKKYEIESAMIYTTGTHVKYCLHKARL